jgi:hypothetical protein
LLGCQSQSGESRGRLPLLIRQASQLLIAGAGIEEFVKAWFWAECQPCGARTTSEKAFAAQTVKLSSMGGMLISLALAWLGALMGWDHGFEPEALCWGAACLTALVIAIAGIFSMHFELSGTANQHLQETPR